MNNPVDPLATDLAAGQFEAFGLLYERYAGRLFAAAIVMLGRREDAEDVVQEVFLAMVRSRRRLSEIEDLTAYLFAALRHATAQHASRRARLGTGGARCCDGIRLRLEWPQAQLSSTQMENLGQDGQGVLELGYRMSAEVLAKKLRCI